jgi:hypothetical protein
MLDGWSDFFVATVGAAAALAGLIIVAMSVNIKTIVDSPAMPSRAAVTIGSLVLLVVVGAAGLIPAITPTVLGVVTLVGTVGLALLVTQSSRMLVRHRSDAPPGANLGKIALEVLQLIPFAVGAVLLISGGVAAGMVAIALGFLTAFVLSAINAWVLLVEVLR